MAAAPCNGSQWDMGQDTLPIPMSMYAENRARLVQKVLETENAPKLGVALFQGGDATPLYNTDVDLLFRQEPFFQWAFGVREPGCYGAIQLTTGKAALFVPRFPESYEVWMGPLPTIDEFLRKYEVDNVYYVDEILPRLKELTGPYNLLLTLSGLNSDSGLTLPPASFDGMNEFTVNPDFLWNVIAECRVFKSQKEVDVIRYANKVSSEAHKLVMRSIRPGMMEYQGEAMFAAYCYHVGGCRHVSYTCICGSGVNGSILHYGHAAAPNDRQIKEGDMCLFDMGCSYFGYGADITCSFPVNGKFTEDQKFVYNAVLSANQEVMRLAKPGVSWRDMHEASYRVLLTALRDGGLLQGDVQEMINAGLGATFMPHGLGHFMGLDVHDVGGYLPDCPPRPTEPGFRSLRTARILQPGMVLTIEPGCYFIDKLLDDALADPAKSIYMVPDVINRFRGFGGVRIEDDVHVTVNGVENLTTVPRTIEEIEEWMANWYIPGESGAPLTKIISEMSNSKRN